MGSLQVKLGPALGGLHTRPSTLTRELPGEEVKTAVAWH